MNAVKHQWRLADLIPTISALGGAGNVHARMQHLQRCGYPPAGKTGRGKMAFYSGEDVLFIAIAEELHKAGVTARRVIDLMIDQCWLEKWLAGDAIYRPNPSTNTHIVLDYTAITKAIWEHGQRTGRPIDFPRTVLRGRPELERAA